MMEDCHKTPNYMSTCLIILEMIIFQFSKVYVVASKVLLQRKGLVLVSLAVVAIHLNTIACILKFLRVCTSDT